MGKRIVWTEQARVDVRRIEQSIAVLNNIMPPLIRLRAQNQRTAIVLTYKSVEQLRPHFPGVRCLDAGHAA